MKTILDRRFLCSALFVLAAIVFGILLFISTKNFINKQGENITETTTTVTTTTISTITRPRTTGQSRALSLLCPNTYRLAHPHVEKLQVKIRVTRYKLQV